VSILIVEDEHRVSQHIQQALVASGHEVVACQTIAQVRAQGGAYSHDLVVLDLGLPDGDGLLLLEEWRGAGYSKPVLILSARDAVEDRIRGLDVGADDYLSKPFSVDELLARVRVHLRRLAQGRPQQLSFRGITMDLLAHSVMRHGRTVLLTSREFSLLEFFFQNPSRVLSRRLIAEKVWGVTYEMQTNLIEVYIRKLRTKLEDPGEPQIIRTLRGSGYVLETDDPRPDSQ